MSVPRLALQDHAISAAANSTNFPSSLVVQFSTSGPSYQRSSSDSFGGWRSGVQLRSRPWPRSRSGSRSGSSSRSRSRPGPRSGPQSRSESRVQV
eukprot:3941583-Rhodomonas_salina.3